MNRTHTENTTDTRPATLASLAHESGYRVGWLAARVGVNRAHLSLVLHGHRPLSRSLAERLAPFLETTPERLIEISAPAARS